MFTDFRPLWNSFGIHGCDDFVDFFSHMFACIVHALSFISSHFVVCFLRLFVETFFDFLHLYQVTIMAQGGFALLKQIAVAHLDNATVQEKLCRAVRNLALNVSNQVRRPDGGMSW